MYVTLPTPEKKNQFSKEEELPSPQGKQSNWIPTKALKECHLGKLLKATKSAKKWLDNCPVLGTNV